MPDIEDLSYSVLSRMLTRKSYRYLLLAFPNSLIVELVHAWIASYVPSITGCKFVGDYSPRDDSLYHEESCDYDV